MRVITFFCLSLCLALEVANAQNYALDFDGVNDYVEISDNDVLDITGSMTVEAWVNYKVLSGGNYYRIVSKGEYNDGWIFGTTYAYTVDFTFNTTQTAYAQTPLQTGKWYHIAAVIDNSAKKIYLYLNGSLDNLSGYSFSGNLPSTSHSLKIGKSNAGYYCNAYVDEVRIWNYARTQSQIQEYMHKTLNGNESGLVAYYKMSDGSGTTLTDNSSYSNDGTLTNMDSNDWVTSTAPIASSVTSGKTDLNAVWSADNSNSSSIMTITDSDISGTDRIIFGHDNGSLSANLLDVPAGIDRRLNRVWRMEVFGSLSGDIIFDCTDLGVTDGTTLRLLKDSDGTFSDAAIISGSYSSPNFTVSGSNFSDGYYYTLSSTSSDNSLPVTISSFTATAGSGQSVILKWITESEVNNAGFILERREENSDLWQCLTSYLTNDAMKSKGNTSNRTEYTYTDFTIEAGHSYYYRISEVDIQGNVTTYPPILFQPGEPPEKTFLEKAFPNPLNPDTYIVYHLSEATHVNITIYDVLGSPVKVLYNGLQNAGSYHIYWNGTNENSIKVPSGTYIIRMKTDKITQNQKVIVIN